VVMLSVQPQTVAEGGKVSFLCTATSNPELTGDRWAKGGVPIPEANGDSYEAIVNQSFFMEPVSCEGSNAVGSTLVDVHFGARLISQPKPLTVGVGSDASFTCTWAGSPPLTLAWTKKGSSVVSSNGNALHLKAVTQEDAGMYVCKAIVPRIGVAEKAVAVNGPPIIGAEPSLQTAVGAKARLECLVGSVPPPDRIAWSWGEWVLDAGSLDRFTVDTMVTDQGVLSALLIDPTHDSDFTLAYNCTAWNRFGARSATVPSGGRSSPKQISLCRSPRAIAAQAGRVRQRVMARSPCYVKPSSYEKAESGYEQSDQASKTLGCSSFSYTSLSQQSDYGRPARQRMQTHV
ncbi:kin of IRRE-like protein 1, partial [Tiliqua scincoides]|uniref:kin of IRRE-like protein 1 n=1 Tax=Tiliqua scincoides TaxID=71010 RepID=UPI0034625022